MGTKLPEVLRIDLVHYARGFDVYFGGFFPRETGIYHPSGTRCMATLGSNVLVGVDKTPAFLTNLDNLQFPVHDQNGRVIAVDNRFRREPVAQSYQLDLMALYADDVLNNRSKWCRNTDQFGEKVRELVLPDLVSNKDDLFDLVCDMRHSLFDIHNHIETFLGRNRWLIFHAKRSQNFFDISRDIDYRIRYFEELRRNGEWKL